MFNNKNVRSAWRGCAVVAVLLAVGCVSAAVEEPGESVPPGDRNGVGGENISVGSVVSSSVLSSSSVVDSPSQPLPGGATTTAGEEAVTVVEVGEGNGGGGEAPRGAAAPGEVAHAEVRVSEEGLERLRKVLGEDKFSDVLEKAEWLAEHYGEDSGVLLGRLAGEGGFLTEEGLEQLAERRSGESLALVADSDGYSEEVLAGYAREGEEWMVGPRGDQVSQLEGRFADGYSDERVKGWAFAERALAEYDPLVGNDVSTPVGAFCWAVLRVTGSLGGSWIDAWQGATRTELGGGFRFWESRNLRVWHLEREAAERGIELEWETPPLDADRTFRRVLLEVTAPGIRSVVFASGLPALLRPAAEALYGVYDELLALPLRRVRPTVEELSGYRYLEDFTEEEITQIWPEEFEVDYRDEDEAKYLEAEEVLDDEAKRLLNAECQASSYSEGGESACPPWVREIEGLGLLSTWCDDSRAEFQSLFSCSLFPTSEDIRESELYNLLEGCTFVDEEAIERFKEYTERAFREGG